MRKLITTICILILFATSARAQQLNPGGFSGGPTTAVFPPGPVRIMGNSPNGTDVIQGVTINGWQNVMAWGADPSGALDSTSAFNNAALAADGHDANNAEYWGTVFCPPLYWDTLSSSWKPAHYKFSSTVFIRGWENVECADAIWDFSGAPANVVGVQLGSNPQDQSLGAWIFHPAHVKIGVLWGPGQNTSSIGIVTGNCPSPSGTGPNGRGCAPNGLYGQWMKSQLTNTNMSYWGTALAIGGNTYDNQFTRNMFWMNGVGYDERYMWQGTFTNGGTDMVLSENTFTYNKTAAYICASNELNMQDNAFEDNYPPYIIYAFCNGAGGMSVKIRSRFEFNNAVGGPLPTAGQPEFIDLQAGVGQLDLSGSNFVDSGAPNNGTPVCYDTNFDNTTNGHISFDNTYAGFLANNGTRPLFGYCTGNTNAAFGPPVSYFHVRPIGVAIPNPATVKLDNPTLNVSGTIVGTAPQFAQAAFDVNDHLYGIITRLVCINQDGAACTSAPTLNVFAASTGGNPVVCSNTLQTSGSFNIVNQNLAVGPGINFGILESAAGSGCSARFLTSMQLIQTQ